MIVAINFADKRFIRAQSLNSKTARKHGADNVIMYSPDDIDGDFFLRNKAILTEKRGFGYWLWKPYIIRKTMNMVNEGDFIVYSDAGSAFVNDIGFLTEVMKRDKTDIMCFCINQIEKKWTKREVLIRLNADKGKYIDNNQICATYIIVRNTDYSRSIIQEYYELCQDYGLITDAPSVDCNEYPEFVEHRHDQSIWSIVCKKNCIKPYRDPSQFGFEDNGVIIPEDVLRRSDYPQIIESHRNPNLHYFFQLDYADKWYHRILFSIYDSKSLRRGICNYVRRSLRK